MYRLFAWKIAYWFCFYAMVQGKLFLIQSNDPSASSTTRWRPAFADTPSIDEFLQGLANHLELSTEKKSSMTIELYDAIKGSFCEFVDLMNLQEVFADNKPTQLLVKYSFVSSNSEVPMIRGRAFDTSSGLLMKTDRGEYNILLQEPGIAHLGTGLNTWDGSIVLAKYLERHSQQFVKNKKILELGAGTGIAGMAAALLGAKLTLLTDLDYVLPNLEANVRSNMPSFVNIMDVNNSINSTGTCSGDVSSSIGVRRCDWMDDSTYPNDLGSWDVILGADIVWIESLVPSLVNALAQCADENTTIIISHQTRSSHTDKLLYKLLDMHFDVSMITRSEYHEDFSVPQIHIFSAKKKKSS